MVFEVSNVLLRAAVEAIAVLLRAKVNSINVVTRTPPREAINVIARVAAHEAINVKANQIIIPSSDDNDISHHSW
jgi:hypothetical protein